MKGRIQLRPDAPSNVRSAFASIPELVVTTGPDELIELGGVTKRITIISRPPRTDDGVSRVDAKPAPGTVGVVVGKLLTAQERTSLENAGLSWCDARGGLHVTWPGLYVHVDRGTRTSAKVDRSSSAGVGATSIRAIQTMLAQPDAPWSTARLAKLAAVSTGQAHNVMKTLEGNRLLRSEGSGPKQRRYLREADDVMQWLAGIERARRRPESASSYLYARTFEDLTERFAKRATEHKIRYALTGVSGAMALGHQVMTNSVFLQVRVSPIDAAHALDTLGLERLDAEDARRGANLELWTDTGELGTFRPEIVSLGSSEISVAPRIRVWLDMVRQGGRVADAADLFKEQALD